MKRSIFLICLLLSFLYILISPQPTMAAVSQLSPELKILSFNTGPRYGTEAERYDRYYQLARFIKERDIEIIGLQEQKIFPNEAAGDGELLLRAAKDVGYPLHLIQVAGVGDSKHESNIIASKYPFVPGTYAEIEINGRNRVMHRVAIQTPYQSRLWVVNLHTNAARPNSPCDQAAMALNVVRDSSNSFSVPPNEPLVVMGDFNVWMFHNGEIGGCNWDNRIHEEIGFYNTTCVNKNTCFQLNNNIDDNGNTRNIDWIITTKNSGTIINATWPDLAVKHLGDGHPPLIGLITHPSFKPTPPLPTTIEPHTDGTYPWTNHGPTSAWTSPSSKDVTICNRALCWIYNLDLRGWKNEGKPYVLQSLWQATGGPQPIPGSNISPWTLPGPTAGWENFGGNTVAIAAGGGPYAWSVVGGGGGWTNGGLPIDLSRDTLWDSALPGPNGSRPWSTPSFTSAFTDSANNILYSCSGSVCWRFNYATRTWNGGVVNGTTQPSVVDLSQVWSTLLAPAPDGTTLFTANKSQGNAPGPVVAWTDTENNKLAICNGRWCWTSQLQQGKYISDGFERKDTAGKAAAYDICTGWSGNALTNEQCQTQVNQVTEGAPTSPTLTPTEIPIGDLNYDGKVNIFDYSLLISALYTTKCEYNLTPNSPADNDCLLNIQDYNVLIGEILKANQ